MSDSNTKYHYKFSDPSSGQAVDSFISNAPPEFIIPILQEHKTDVIIEVTPVGNTPPDAPPS